MSPTSQRWRGCFPALVTPFTQRLSLDTAGLSRYVTWLADQGVHGLLLAGTLGEWHALSDEERRSMLDVTVDARPPSVPVLMGCTDYTATGVLRRIRLAADHGADGALVAAPPYLRLDEPALWGFFATVASLSPLPICVYNWPPGTGDDLSPAFLAELASMEPIVAIKSSTPDAARFAETVERVGPAAAVFGVPLNQVGLDLLAAGAAGTIGAAGVVAEQQVAFFERAWVGDAEGALRAGEVDQTLLRRWFTSELTGRHGAAPAVLKVALGHRGLPSGPVRPPLLDLGPTGRAAVAADLVELDITPVLA